MEKLQQRFEETTIDDTLRNSNKETFIILDSCVHIKSRKQKSHLLTVLAGKMGRYGAQLVLPRIVIHEISKVTRSSKHQVLKDIFKNYNQTLLLADSNDVKVEAKRLETHFYECHRADSIILATAKVMCGILVTYDAKLLRTAQLEGVQAYGVKEFVKHWSVLS